MSAVRGGVPGPPRRAIVLGGGGVLGYAWMLGALSALESVSGFDAREADVVVGTSAGSVLAGLLGCGLPVEAMCRHHQGVPEPGDPPIAYDYTGTGSALPPRPSGRPASPGLLAEAMRRPGRLSPLVALTGLLPPGRGSLQTVHSLLHQVAGDAGFAQNWPNAPRPWVVAADYRTGRRVVFGRTELPGRAASSASLRVAPLPDAVLASCSIPGWFPPTVIGGIPYVDGGVLSNASVDVLFGVPLDEVYVLAPMGALHTAHPPGTLARLDHRVRRWISRRILADAARLRSTGVRVSVLAPAQAELDVMGLNLMDPSRRLAVLESARRGVRHRLGVARDQGVAGAGAPPAGNAVAR